MKLYNKAILMGRLTRDPELRQTPNGTDVTLFTIAVDRPRDKSTTDFIDVVAWRNIAEFICRYFTKGKAILVEGYIQTREYTDKKGNNRKVYEIVAEQVRFTGDKNIDIERTEPNSRGDTNDFTELDDDGDLPF